MWQWLSDWLQHQSNNWREKRKRQDRLRLLTERVKEQKRDQGFVVNALIAVQEHEHCAFKKAFDAQRRFRKKRGIKRLPTNYVAECEATEAEIETLQQRRDEHAEDPAGAVAAFRAYVEIHPRSTLAMSFLLVALRSAGDFAGAIAVCRDAIAAADAEYDGEPLSFDSVLYRLTLGDLLMESGDVRGAIAHLTKSLRATRKKNDALHPSFSKRLGDAYDAIGNRSAARRAWSDTLRYDVHGEFAPEVTKRLREIA